MADAKIVFLCNPNNPTSKLIPQAALARIIEAAFAKDTLVFLDEDFLEFVEDEKNLTLIRSIGKYPNLFLLRSFTKIYGLTGLRVGYGIADSDIIKPLSCAKIPWNINCIAQSAAASALQDGAHLKVTRNLIKKEKTYLSAELAKFESFKFEEPDANFYFIDTKKAGLTAAQLKSKLLQKSILIRDCTSFRGLDKYHVRIAVKTHQENIRLIEALQWALKG
jgi:threonine-phosphate decarboxylase